jgi:hypothetical protein
VSEFSDYLRTELSNAKEELPRLLRTLHRRVGYILWFFGAGWGLMAALFLAIQLIAAVTVGPVLINLVIATAGIVASALMWLAGETILKGYRQTPPDQFLDL